MTPARILVVEDEAVVALDLRMRLTSLGYDVVEVTAKGEMAIALAKQLRPDLTLMDIRLRGELDGIEAAETIRTQLTLPVVYLTAHADEATIDRARLTEPFGYILKPFDERELRTVIEMALYKHQVERKLRESERRFATTLASIGDGVIATDRSGHVTFMNAVAEKLTGWPCGEAQGALLTKVFAICNEDTRLPVANPVERVLAEGIVVGLANHTILISRDGLEAPIADCAAPIFDDHGELTGTVLVFRDDTEKRHVERQLQQSKKMAAVGQLAGGIVHDFNNMLTVILSSSEILLDSAGQDHPWSQLLKEIRRAGLRSAELTNHLLTFCRKQLVEPQSIDLNDAVLQTEQVLRRLIGENIELRVNLSPDVGCVRMDPGQIERILINLAVNARDAISDQGTMQIETKKVEVSTEQFPTLSSGTYHYLSFSDNGQGIPLRYRDRIFEPFFTTKEQGKGTGLGLAVVYGIVNQCDGHIDFVTETGRGTTFRIYLPATIAATVAEASPKSTLHAKGNETILLVEDEPSLRTLSRQILCTHGYTVLEAENGAAGIEVAKGHADQIDIIVTDVVMPVMGARQMVQELRAYLPDLKVLFISGYVDDSLASEVAQFAKSLFLQKPYTISELTTAVRKVLDDPAEES